MRVWNSLAHLVRTPAARDFSGLAFQRFGGLAFLMVWRFKSTVV